MASFSLSSLASVNYSSNIGPFTLPPPSFTTWFSVTILSAPGGIEFDKDHIVTPGATITVSGFSISLNQNGVGVQANPTEAQSTEAMPSPSISQPSATGLSTTTPEPTESPSPPQNSATSGVPSQIPASGVPTSIPTSRKDVSKGAAAGIAIGCFIAGALIAGLLLWFCVGRVRKKRTSPDHEASAMALMNRDKGSTAKALSVESSSPMSLAMESGLPQPLEDKAISDEISKISNLIKNHVQSYYHSNRVSPGLLDVDDIQAFGDDLPISTGTLSTLLSNSETREIALRFCLSWVIISRMQLKSGPAKTLLPPEVADCFQSMAFVDRASPAQLAFLSKWRVITAQLMHTSYTRNPFSPSDSRKRNLDVTLRTLDAVLLSYADSRIMDKSERRRNLEEILKRAATFAFTLFSQPTSWEFDWQDEQGVLSGSLCVFPALIQITDEAGEVIKPPRAFSEAILRRLDG